MKNILIAVGTIATAYFIAHLIKSSLESLKTNEQKPNKHGSNNMGPYALPLQ